MTGVGGVGERERRLPCLFMIKGSQNGEKMRKYREISVACMPVRDAVEKCRSPSLTPPSLPPSLAPSLRP
jgi:hypothetical protein